MYWQTFPADTLGRPYQPVMRVIEAPRHRLSQATPAIGGEHTTAVLYVTLTLHALRADRTRHRRPCPAAQGPPFSRPPSTHASAAACHRCRRPARPGLPPPMPPPPAAPRRPHPHWTRCTRGRRRWRCRRRRRARCMRRSAAAAAVRRPRPCLLHDDPCQAGTSGIQV